MIKTVKLNDPNLELSKVLAITREGNEVVIEDEDKPIARVIPFLEESKPRIPGLHRDMIWIRDDFDEPLSEEFLDNSF